MQTCLNMLPAVGAWVQVRFESLWIECEVIDVKNSWGKDWRGGGFCFMQPDYLTWNETQDLWVPTLGYS